MEHKCSWDDLGKTYCSGTVSRLWNIWLCDFHKSGLRYLMKGYQSWTVEQKDEHVRSMEE